MRHSSASARALQQPTVCPPAFVPMCACCNPAYYACASALLHLGTHGAGCSSPVHLTAMALQPLARCVEQPMKYFLTVPWLLSPVLSLLHFEWLCLATVLGILHSTCFICGASQEKAEAIAEALKPHVEKAVERIRRDPEPCFHIVLLCNIFEFCFSRCPAPSS